MKKEDLILSKFKASEFIKSKEEAIRFFDTVLEIALGDSKKFFMKSFEDVINSFSGWEEYKSLSSDKISKEKGEEIIEELEVENKELKDRLDNAHRTLCEVLRMSLLDEKDISKIYDIVNPTLEKLNQPLTQYKQRD